MVKLSNVSWRETRLRGAFLLLSFFLEGGFFSEGCNFTVPDNPVAVARPLRFRGLSFALVPGANVAT